MGKIGEQPKFRSFQDAGHEQDGIGAEDPGFIHLMLVNNEIFPQNGLMNDGFHLGQRVNVHPEVRFVCQDRNGAYAARLIIDGGDFRHVAVPHRPLRGRFALDLRDQRKLTLERGGERSRRRGVLEAGAQFPGAVPAFRRGDLSFTRRRIPLILAGRRFGISDSPQKGERRQSIYACPGRAG